MNFFEEVYRVVRKVPEGKVATYGQIAEIIGTSDARKVGWALHANKGKKTPCHRVVNRQGKLAENFAFGGVQEQRSSLEAEGVVFVDDMHVNLTKSLWKRK
jgi:methylated-DNA-protein-cysteine methyltransferase-like protein